jgi:hypothetical protein
MSFNCAAYSSNAAGPPFMEETLAFGADGKTALFAPRRPGGLAPRALFSRSSAPMHSPPPPDDDGARWGRVPAWWLDHPAVDADALAVLTALATFADRRGRCWPSQTTLATRLKRSRAWVNKTLGRLADAGLIAVRDRWSENGGRLSCLYELQTAQTPVVGDGAPVAEKTAPCQPRRHEQPESEHITDSLASAAQEDQQTSSIENRPAQTPAADWTPTAEDRRWAETRHNAVDIDRHVEGFRLRCQAHGYRYRDISAAWRAWLDQDAAAGKAPSAGKSSNRPACRATRAAPAEQTLDAWRAVAARLQTAAAPSPYC